MHWYKRNIGDYAKKCGRLTMMQHGAYTLLMDSCYDREVFPTLRDAIDWCWASTKEEVEAVEFVLSRFFTLEDGVYFQKRIVDEVAEYHAKANQNKRIAIERETNRAANRTKRAQVVYESSPDKHEPPPNQEPVTSNQEPLTINQEPEEKTAPVKRTPPPPAPADVDGQTWQDWLQLRKTKKAPVTQTVIKGARAEAEKAGMPLEDFLQVWCRRGSQGLEASWIRPDERKLQPQTFAERDRDAGMARWEEQTGRVHPDRLHAKQAFIEITPKFLGITK